MTDYLDFQLRRDPPSPIVSDEAVSAALEKWYPGEWPNDPVFDQPIEAGGRPWREKVMGEMRDALVAALAVIAAQKEGCA